MQPPKTEENETATRTEPAACHILKCPNLSIYHGNNRKQNYFQQAKVTIPTPPPPPSKSPKQPKMGAYVFNKNFVKIYEFQSFRRQNNWILKPSPRQS